MNKSKSFRSPLFSLSRTGTVGLVVPWKCHQGHPLLVDYEQGGDLFNVASDMDSINFDWGCYENGRKILSAFGLRVPSDLVVTEGELEYGTPEMADWIEKMCPQVKDRDECQFLKTYDVDEYDMNSHTWNAPLCSYFDGEVPSGCMEYGRFPISSDLFVESFIEFNRQYLSQLIGRIEDALYDEIEFNVHAEEYYRVRNARPHANPNIWAESMRNARWRYANRDNMFVKHFLTPQALDDETWHEFSEEIDVRISFFEATGEPSNHSPDLTPLQEAMHTERGFFEGWLQNFVAREMTLSLKINIASGSRHAMLQTTVKEVVDSVVTRETLFMCPGSLLRVIAMKSMLHAAAPFLGTKFDVDCWGNLSYNGCPADTVVYPDGFSVYDTRIHAMLREGSAFNTMTKYLNDRGGVPIWLGFKNDYPDCYCGVGDVYAHMSVCPYGKFGVVSIRE